MPDRRPRKLSAFLAKITRNLALKKWELYNAEKRGSGQVPLALDELRECIPSPDRVDRVADDLALTDCLNRFLASLPRGKRKIFMRRYWNLNSVAEIAELCCVSESKVKMTLLRTRRALKLFLEKEGFDL